MFFHAAGDSGKLLDFLIAETGNYLALFFNGPFDDSAVFIRKMLNRLGRYIFFRLFH